MSEDNDFDFSKLEFASKQKEVMNRTLLSASQVLEALARVLAWARHYGDKQWRAVPDVRERPKVHLFIPQVSNRVTKDQKGLAWTADEWAFILRVAHYSMRKLKDSCKHVDAGLVQRLHEDQIDVDETLPDLRLLRESAIRRGGGERGVEAEEGAIIDLDVILRPQEGDALQLVANWLPSFRFDLT